MRNGVRSRKMTGFDGHSIKVESVTKLDWIGSHDELLSAALKMPTSVFQPGSRRLSKQSMKTSLTLQRLADKMYLAISEAIVFNLSCETAT